MAGTKTFLFFAFFASIGVTLILLACAIPGTAWPCLVLIFYFCAPIPTLVVKRIRDVGREGGPSMDFAIFLTGGLVASAFGLPMILYHSPAKLISATTCYLTLSANVVVFITAFVFCLVFTNEDNNFSLM